MKKIKLMFLGILLVSFLINNCGGGGTTSNQGSNNNGSIVIAPSITIGLQSQTVTVGMTASFSLTASGTQPLSYQWKKDGIPIPGVTSSIYTIASAKETDAGSYSLTISNSAGTTTSNLATLVVSPIVTGPSYELVPAIISPGTGTPLQIVFDGWSSTTSVELKRSDNSVVPLKNVPGTNKWAVALTEAEVLDGYISPDSGANYTLSDLVNYIGTLNVEDPSNSYSVQLFAPILVSGMPDVIPLELAENIQEGLHIVNIRYDDLYSSSNSATDINQIFYQYYADEYDFIVENWLARDANTNAHYRAIRNTVQGTGVSVFDYSAIAGAVGTNRLKGLIYLSPNGAIDLSQQVISHEIGHAFMNFIDGIPLSTNTAHFPISTTAFGIIGTQAPNTSRKLTELSNGDYIVENLSQYGGFNEYELYMLGLIPSTEVPDQIVFADQTVNLSAGTVLEGPGTIVTIDQVISANGARIPAYPEAQTDFHVVTIVVSRGRLLSADEMTYLDYMASRGEEQIPLDEYYGRPFYVSTGGRATLSTSIH